MIKKVSKLKHEHGDFVRCIIESCHLDKERNDKFAF